MKLRFLASSLVVVLACSPGDPDVGWPDDTAADVAPDVLVSADWLAERLEQPGLVLLHVALDPAQYLAGHILGAGFLPLGELVEERNGVLNQLRPVDRLREVFEAAGLSDGDRVVLYDDGAWLPAARAFFTLEYLGHTAVSVLDGGLAAWAEDGREIASSDALPTVQHGRFTPRPRPDRVADASWIHTRLGQPDIALIDARPPDQYQGVSAGAGVPRAGHIPGAANIFWRETVAADSARRLKDEHTLRALYSEAGARPGDRVVAYCRTGMQASHAYLVARHLGFDAVLYDGSFMDWSPRPELPVSSGVGADQL